jgi:hypothetical protein
MGTRIASLSLLSLLAALALLSACAAPPTVAPDGGATQRRLLAESGARIAEALAQLAVVEQASRRIQVQTIATADDAPEALRLRVAVDYAGDLKPFVHQLAHVAGYEVKTYGVSSVLTPINVRADDRAIGELLADAGYQASWRCQLVIDPERRLVEILYDNRRPGGPAARRSRRPG